MIVGKRFIALLFASILVFCSNHAFAETDDLHDEQEDEPEVLLLLVFGVFVGLLVYQLISIYEEVIPYTVIVFILGVIIGAIQSVYSEGTFGNSIESWTRINAELILYIFLPPLLFGEVMNLNWHHVKGGILQSIILAGPGVLMGAALMGCIAKGILPYNWSWNLCMVFGAILAANDPVAVVALLKSVGASPTLTILIVGESLLNDGTAIVLFELFHEMLNGEEFTAGDIIVFALRAVVGSVCVGFAFGMVTLRWLRSAKRPMREEDTLIQTVVTICSAYACFFTAQYSFKMSGVLAVCANGVLIAWLGPPIILSHESMHNVWGLLEWAFNTLIFLLAGLIIGHRRFEADGADWLYLFILFIMLNVVRAAVLGMLYPILSRAGLRVSMQEAVFMSWAGLRGALAMVLGLIVERGTNGNEDKQKEVGRLFFYVSGIAALTLLINATTAKAVLVYLGLIGGDSAQRMLILDVVKRQLRKHMLHEIEMLSEDISRDHLDSGKRAMTLFNERALHAETTVPDTDNPMHEEEEEGGEDAAQQAVQQAVQGQHSAASGRESTVRDSESVRLSTRKHQSSGSWLSRGSHATDVDALRIERLLNGLDRSSTNGTGNGTGTGTGIIPEILQYVRTVFLGIVRAQYWEMIEQERLPRRSHSAQFLLYTIDVAIDEVSHAEKSGARDWARIEEELDAEPWAARLLTWGENSLPSALALKCASIHGSNEALRQKRAVFMLEAFLRAHCIAQFKLHDFLSGGHDSTIIASAVSRHQATGMNAINKASSPEEALVLQESEEAVRVSVQPIVLFRHLSFANLLIDRLIDLFRSIAS